MVLHEHLRPSIGEYFDDGMHGRQGPPNEHISIKLCLSVSLRFFAGAAMYNIMPTNGIGRLSVDALVY